MWVRARVSLSRDGAARLESILQDEERTHARTHVCTLARTHRGMEVGEEGRVGRRRGTIDARGQRVCGSAVGWRRVARLPADVDLEHLGKLEVSRRPSQLRQCDVAPRGRG